MFSEYVVGRVQRISFTRTGQVFSESMKYLQTYCMESSGTVEFWLYHMS